MTYGHCVLNAARIPIPPLVLKIGGARESPGSTPLALGPRAEDVCSAGASVTAEQWAM